MPRTFKTLDVAKGLSISPGTVSKVLRGTSGTVSVQTAEKVLNFCRRKGYMTSLEAGQVLSKIKSRNGGGQIFTVTCRRGILAYDAVFLGICREMQNSGVYSSCFVIHNKEDLKQFRYDKAEGVIIMGRISTELLDEFGRHELPIVLVDNRIGNADVSTVNSNNLESVCNAVGILADSGHKRIAFAVLYNDKNKQDYTFQQRQLGYIAGLNNAGLSYDEELLAVECCSNGVFSDFDHKSVTSDLTRLAERIMKISPLPTAVIAANDLAAYFIRKAVTSKGLRVPEEMSIIGYDGWHRYSAVSNVGFTPTSTMAVDWEEMGHHAIDLMMELQIENENKCRHIEVPTVYDDLGTVAPPGAKISMCEDKEV